MPHFNAHAHLPEIWPSLFEVTDVKTMPDGGHRFMWFYNLAGKRVHGTTETYKRVPYERIVERAKGDVESVFTEWPFVGRNEFEAETLLSNLKAKLEV